MEQVLMDKLLGFLKNRQADGQPFFTYYAPFSIHKRCGRHAALCDSCHACIFGYNSGSHAHDHKITRSTRDAGMCMCKEGLGFGV